MKKIIFSILALFLSLPAFAVIPDGSCVQGITYGSTGAAAANTTAVNNALAKGGKVSICGTGTAAAKLWINASLVIDSYTWLHCNQGVTIEEVTGTNAAVLTNGNQGTIASPGDTNFFSDGCIFDGNQANQTVAFSTVDIKGAAYFGFDNSTFNNALRTGSFAGGTASLFGEGFLGEESQYFFVSNSHANGNVYDGFKTRDSFNALFAANTAHNNGRAGIQISYDHANNAATSPSIRIVVEGLVVDNDSATPTTPSPETTGVYIHAGDYCIINGVTANKVNQLFGEDDNSQYNDFGNSVGIITWDGTHPALSVEPLADADNYNRYHDITIIGGAGANGKVISLNGSLSNDNIFSNILFYIGSGTGTWTANVAVSATNNTLENIHAPGGSFSVSDAGTNTVLRDVDTVGHSAGKRTLTVSGAAVATDASLANAFYFVAPHSATTTISNPTNAYAGQKILYEVQQDSTGGSAVLAYGTAFTCGAGLTTALSSGANATDLIGFYYSANLSKWVCIGTSLNN